jgi:hypothetical protein
MGSARFCLESRQTMKNQRGKWTLAFLTMWANCFSFLANATTSSDLLVKRESDDPNCVYRR